MKKHRIVNLLFFVSTMLIFYIPIVLILIFSFNFGKSSEWEGFSFKWYQELFLNSERLWLAAGMSFIIGVSSAVLSTILGCMGAWAIWHKNNKLRMFLLSLSYMPLMLPDLIVGVSLLTLFVFMALPLGVGSIFIAHTTMNIPFALLLILSVLNDSDLSVLEAAKDLGAGEFQIWTRVLLPMLFPALTASFVLALTMSLDDFAITFFVSGPGSTTLPIYVYSAIRFGVSPAINALSVLIIGISIILFVINKRYIKMAFK
ncbi:MAG: ABC transporter permease [Brevinemataceae bacterium]